MNASLQRMEEKIAGVAADMEKLKKDLQRTAQLLGTGSSGQVHSTPQVQSVSPPAPNQEDSLTTRVLWTESMEFQSDDEEEAFKH